MKYSLVLTILLNVAFFSTACASQQGEDVETITVPTSTINVSCQTQECQEAQNRNALAKEDVLARDRSLRINVIGQGVAPTNTSSPAQAYALAKRAATADAYRLIAEKVKGVRVEGQDLIQNMMIKRSSVRTSVSAMVRDANVVETTFKEGLCEVEMEIILSHSQFQH
jgi:outer membrane protein FlgP